MLSNKITGSGGWSKVTPWQEIDFNMFAKMCLCANSGMFAKNSTNYHHARVSNQTGESITEQVLS